MTISAIPIKDRMIVYDYEVVKHIFNRKYLNAPIINKTTTFGAGSGRTVKRAFICEASLREHVIPNNCLTWAEFEKRYLQEIRKGNNIYRTWPR